MIQHTGKCEPDQKKKCCDAHYDCKDKKEVCERGQCKIIPCKDVSSNEFIMIIKSDLIKLLIKTRQRFVQHAHIAVEKAQNAKV